jgi:hypothetical protein
MDKYKIKLSDKVDNLNAIALVEDPAIESNFLFFNNENDKKIFEFAIENEEKRTLIGAAMIPEKLIYRVDKKALNKYEYEIVFSKEEVKNISKKFINGEKKFNLLHNNELVAAVELLESWIVEDTDNDKINFYKMKNIPVGSWIIMTKINDDKLWQLVKEGKFNGFSVEGFFDMEEKFSNKKQILNEEKDLYSELSSLLDEILLDIDNIK